MTTEKDWEFYLILWMRVVGTVLVLTGAWLHSVPAGLIFTGIFLAFWAKKKEDK